MSRKQPLIYGTFNVFINGGLDVLGVVDATLPDTEAKTETVSGAGIMGDIEVPVRGQFAAATLTLSFRAIYDSSVLGLAVGGNAYRFDLRPALEVEDTSSYDKNVVAERWSITGPVKKISHGKRAPASAADASIEVACRRIEQYMNGKKIMERDYLNGKYNVGESDIYAPVRNAIS